MRLGVNIDHIATLRQARGTDYPSPVQGAVIAEKAGADFIVSHLREDRRHIQDKDIFAIKRRLKTGFNLEMALSGEIINIALKLKPDKVTIVPEKRKELTTEGGLDLNKNRRKLEQVLPKFKRKSIAVSLFVNPAEKDILAAKELGVEEIEIHTGRYADAAGVNSRQRELTRIKSAVELALSLGLRVAAGHGLNYSNVSAVAKIKGIEELNIGHSIIAEAVFNGLYTSIRKMMTLVR